MLVINGIKGGWEWGREEKGKETKGKWILLFLISHRILHSVMFVIMSLPFFSSLSCHFVFFAQIFGDYYHFQHRKVAKRSALPGIHHDRLLNDDPEVFCYSHFFDKMLFRVV